MRLKHFLADWRGGWKGGAEGLSAMYSCIHVFCADRHRPCNHCTDIQTVFGMCSQCFRVASSVSVPGSFNCRKVSLSKQCCVNSSTCSKAVTVLSRPFEIWIRMSPSSCPSVEDWCLRLSVFQFTVWKV